MRPLLRFEPAPPPLYATLPRLELVDQDGQDFQLADSERPLRLGAPVRVVGFFSTGCHAECEPVLSGLSQLSARYRDEGVEGVEVIAITVDPARDDPGALRDFASDRWLEGEGPRLLTGDPAQVRMLLLEGFHAGDPRVLLARASRSRSASGAAPVPFAAETEDPAALATDHRLVIVDRSGGLRGSYTVDAAGLDEVFHRSQHVLEEKRSPREARLPHP